MRAPSTRLMQDLGTLIALPSVSSTSPGRDMSNRPVAEFLASRCEDLGCHVRLQDVPGAPGKVNLIATLGQGRGSGRSGLVLAGHTDTVPCDEPRWSSDPFRLTERNGRLHGLGTADMKAFFALVLHALENMDTRRLRAPLVLLATADEESTMAGARALTAGQVGGRFALIGEPTDLKPVRRHKGVLMERIILTGRSGHSSDPSLGRNALDGMTRVLAELMRWREELQRRRDPGFGVPFTTLNLGRIQGGDNPNRICGRCELDIDLRPIPGVGRDEVRSVLHRRVAEAVAGTGLEVGFVALFAGADPLDTAADSPLVEIVQALTGTRAGAVPFATEGPLLSRLGLDVVVLGPGRLDQAHQPDEYLELASIDPMIATLNGLIDRLCLKTPE